MKTNITFLGLGTMGIGMVRRLLKVGEYPITVYNRNAEKAAPLIAEGAKVARTPREAAQGAQVVIAMLSDDAASRAIWLGENGALAGAGHGAVAIECSTLTVPWVRELAAAAEKRGLKFLDAPVTGTKPHAANGELTFLVGGESGVLEQVRPVLKPMSKEIVHLGPVGSGAAFKLVNNFMCGVQIASLAEAFALMSRAGLDLETALPLLINGAPGSPLVKLISTRHANKDYAPNFQLKLMAKDLTYAQAQADQHHLKLQTAAAALDRFNQAAKAGLGEEDIAALVKYLEKS